LQEPLPGETQQQVSTQVWQLQQLLQPVSPDHDPFMLARHVFLGPFDARAHTITLEDLKQMWLQDVQELRACLQQLQSTLQQGGVLLVAPPPGDSDDVPAAAATRASPHACRTDRHPQDEQRQQQQHTNPLKAIRDRMMSMYHLVNSLSIAGRHNLYFDLQLENWKTGAGAHACMHTCTHAHCLSTSMCDARAQPSPVLTGRQWRWQLNSPGADGAMLERFVEACDMDVL
jgi:hypothetical protein